MISISAGTVSGSVACLLAFIYGTSSVAGDGQSLREAELVLKYEKDLSWWKVQ